MSYFNCLLVGDWGTGKTTAASTAPKPILYLDVDDKLHKMVNLQDKLEKKEIIQWKIEAPLGSMSLSQRAMMDPKAKSVAIPTPKGYRELAAMIDKLKADKCIVNGVKIATIVLDSYTSMDEHLRRLLMAHNHTDRMTQPLYGVILVNFEEINDTLLHLPANVIFIAHKKAIKDELTGKISYEPLINGSMSSKIGKCFEEVYAMKKKVQGTNVTYQMDTVGSSMEACRTSRNLPAIVEPNFEKIYGMEVKK